MITQELVTNFSFPPNFFNWLVTEILEHPPKATVDAKFGFCEK
jgi:hypothetical protein